MSHTLRVGPFGAEQDASDGNASGDLGNVVLDERGDPDVFLNGSTGSKANQSGLRWPIRANTSSRLATLLQVSRGFI